MPLTTAELNIYIYTGTSTDYTDNDIKYTIQKARIGDDTNIVFEVAELVRDYLTHNFNDDYPSDAVWVRTSITLFDESDIAYSFNSPVVNTYIAVDGYGFFEDQVNPELQRHALLTANTIYLPEGTAGKLPIFAEGVGKVTIDSVDTQITDNGNSNQKIQYVTIPADSDEIKVYDTDDSTLLKTITINNICEPKFTQYKVTFVNKYGAYQDLWFFKKSVESFNVTDETFKKNTVSSSSASYNLYEGQKERYNTNATKSISLNTGFINEDSNSTIEELFLSENVYIRQDSQTIPIIPKSKSLTLKTSVNDKLSNYTIEFDYAFNKINNVR
jgi:hypothetical protein